MHNFVHSSGSRKVCKGSNNQEGRCQRGSLFWSGGMEKVFVTH